MPRRRELIARRHKQECLAAEETEKRAEMDAAVARQRANETPERRAEREERERQFQKQQDELATRRFYETRERLYWSKRSKSRRPGTCRSE
jgi:hypothetical protein